MGPNRGGHLIWRALAAPMVVICFSVLSASAQRALVETTTLSAVGEAVRVSVHSVDFQAGAVLPLPAVLPGDAPVSPMVMAPAGSMAIVTTGVTAQRNGHAPETSLSYLSLMRTSPFRVLAHHLSNRDGGWREAPVALIDDTETNHVVALGTRVLEPGSWEGRLSLYPLEDLEAYTSSTPAPPAIPEAVWPLPGPPEAAVLLRGDRHAAIVGRGRFGTGAWLHVRDLRSGAAFVDTELGTRADTTDTDPGGVAVSLDGTHLFVITSGYAADSPTGDPTSWLRVYETGGLTAVGSPLELPGLARVTDAVLHPDRAGGVWVATRWPVAGFAYASHVTVTSEGAVRDVARSFTTTYPVLMAASPSTDAVMVGVGTAVERWDGQGDVLLRREYNEPVGLLRWTGEGVFAGEAGRLHLIDELSLQSMSVLRLKSGHVSDLLLIPSDSLPDDDVDGDGLSAAEEQRAGTDGENHDTDGDGIPDGVDAEPLAPSPLIEIPTRLVFRGESLGRDVKSLLLDAHGGIGSAFRISISGDHAAWLRAAPAEGQTPARILVGIDPVYFAVPSGSVLTVPLDISLAGVDVSAGASLSPQRVEIHVLPKASGARRILWLWSEHREGHLRSASDPRRFKRVADLLGGAPHYFSHVEHAGPFSGSLAAYTIMVLECEAAARGVINPRDVLEYVGHGGALLFVGAHLPDTPASALRWMRPMGLTADPSVAVNGLFAAEGASGLTRHWSSVSIRDGAALTPVRGQDALVVAAEAGSAIFMATDYGRGRVAALAGGTPLESAAQAKPEGSRFASDLFRWLAQARMDVADRDSDGLPDWVEDGNGNRIVDWGETNPDRADSDGDGIPDGQEDVNWNGMVDEGETDPLKADSDGDGIFDGADPSAVPTPGEPLLAHVNPASGPAEGGNEVRISGTHLPADSEIWFGSRRAPRVRQLSPSELMVEVPTASEEGPVDVRLVGPASGEEKRLVEGYRYLPRTELGIVIQTLAIRENPDGSYRGRTSVRMEGPPTNLRRADIYLRCEPATAVTWGAVEAGKATFDLRRRVTGDVEGPGLLVIQVHEQPVRHQPLQGQIAVVNWRATPPPDGEPLKFYVDRAVMRVRSGEALPTALGEALYPLERAPRPQREQP